MKVCSPASASGAIWPFNLFNHHNLGPINSTYNELWEVCFPLWVHRLTEFPPLTIPHFRTGITGFEIWARTTFPLFRSFNEAITDVWTLNRTHTRRAARHQAHWAPSAPAEEMGGCFGGVPEGRRTSKSAAIHTHMSYMPSLPCSFSLSPMSPYMTFPQPPKSMGSFTDHSS